MITVENIIVPSGTEIKAAIYGMRNSYMSRDKSDSTFDEHEYILGVNDSELMRKLMDAGTSHRKFCRFLNVYADITAPMYWWKEFDTYRFGVEKNSESTMHSITNRPLVMADFSTEAVTALSYEPVEAFNTLIDSINVLRKLYIQTNNKTYWKALIQMLPSSYNQRRSVIMSYEALLNMYYSRKNHKLTEWREFCKVIETFPIIGEYVGGGDNS